MASIEIREQQKMHLMCLLKLKRANEGVRIRGLSDELLNAVCMMKREDVAQVEKMLGMKALQR